MDEDTSAVRSYRERGISAQQWAAEAATDGLRSIWLELAERYFELAEREESESPLKFKLETLGDRLIGWRLR